MVWCLFDAYCKEYYVARFFWRIFPGFLAPAAVMIAMTTSISGNPARLKRRLPLPESLWRDFIFCIQVF